MEPPENPSANLRTTADRLSDVSPLVWLVLGVSVVIVFSVLAFLLTGFTDG